MACADADTLAALLANAVSDGERQAIAIHAATCEACHALLDGLLDGARDETGTTVGRYVIGARLGAGGMGVVYAAVDSELQRKVAVKLLRPDGTGELGSEGRERLMREARVLASLSHPNVVTVFDVGTHDGDLFLAMELVDGGTLNTWLRSAPRSIAEILDRLIDAGRGLAAAHAAGVVHRDVKPDNILVGNDGRARVTDFGLAGFDRTAEPVPTGLSPALAGDLTRTGTRMGTPMYMAPEQLASGTADPRSDQWAFCAMAYEVLAGVRPFPSDDPAARAAAITAGRVAPPKRRLPGWVLAIVTRGLRADPDARWRSMDAVVEALVRGRRRRIVRWAALAVGAVAVTSSLAFAMRRTPTESYAMPDPRPGCNCRMSACDDHCVSVCNASEYTVGPPIPGISLPGRQEALHGMSSDGDAILYLAGTGCSLDRLWLARRDGARYVPVDLTDRIDRTRAAIFENCCTLAPDGRSLLVARADRRGFVRVSLDDFTHVDLGPLVPSDATKIQLWYPVLAADQRTLYYRVADSSLGPTDQGPLDGVYAAQADGERFAPGVRLPGRARYYDAVSGVSSDQLSLFMMSEYRTHILVRARTDEPFGDPGVNMLPALLPGWRSVPTADCRRIATTWTPGGCAAEDIVFLDAKP